jgi:hypothetical protein
LHPNIAYAAYTEQCTLLLDEDGVCRRVLLRQPSRRGDKAATARGSPEGARRCVGAQYVASIDTSVEGGLVPMPRPGAAMLFAYMGDDGRLAVVRTGALVRFETVYREREGSVRIELDTLPPDTIEDMDSTTLPLRQSGERRSGNTPPRSWAAPAPHPQPVRLQHAVLLRSSESSPTLLRVQPPRGRGAVPRRR